MPPISSPIINTNTSVIRSTDYGSAMPRLPESQVPNNWQLLRECLHPILGSIGVWLLMFCAAQKFSKSEKESEVIGKAIEYTFGILVLGGLPLYALATCLSNRSGYSSGSSDSTSSNAWFYHGGDFSSGHYGDSGGDGGGGVGDGGGAC